VNIEFLEQKPLLLVFPYDVMAHYLRCLQLARYFKPWFTIRFLYSERYQAFVSAAGFETFTAATLDADNVQQCVESFDFSWLNETDLSYMYEDQVKVIKELRPAVVLGDMAPTLKMAAEKTGVFYISLLNGYMTRYYAYVRRMPESYPLYKLFNLLPASLHAYFTGIGENIYFHDIHRPFRKIRSRAGLSSKDSYMQEMEGDLNLVCDLSELFPQKEVPGNYLFVPPLFHPANDNDSAVINKLDINKKTLLINMGSTGNWKKVAFLNKPAYQKYNIVTAGDKEKIISGAHVTSCHFINNHPLLEAVDLVICHGGNGTSYQAFSYGIPVLCLTSNLEQDYNTDGIERCHLGKRLNKINESGYIDIIDQYIQEKHTGKFTWIKNNIAASVNKFEEQINGVVDKSLGKKAAALNI
jgi:UDP:flavonoid glycosyltransferase YjiC (YdhE family)